MPFNITIDHATTANNSDRSSLSTDEEDSSGTGVQVSPRSAAGSQDYSDHAEEPEGSWTNVYPDEIGPSDSASRPRTSNQQRPLVEAPQPQEARRPLYRRHITQERPRNLPQPRAHRAPPSESESVDSHEERWAYAQSPPQQYGHHYARFAAAPPGYPSPHAYQQYTAPSAVAPGQQQMVPYGFSAYQQHAPPPGPAPGYFGHHGVPSHEMMPHNPHPGFYSYPPQQQGFPMPVSPPPAMYPPYPLMYPPAPPVAAPAPVPTPAPPAAPADPPPAAASPQPPLDSSRDDEKFARLEKLFLDEKADRDAREAAAAKALADAEAKAKADKEKAEEIAAASSAAAAAAKAEAQQEYKDATEKANAEAAAAEAAAAAAAAAAPPPPPKEKDKPIKFKDAIGRRFNFPFHMCNTWTGMEYLIKEAFLHVENYGPHVAEGMYDLLGPHGEIVMKSVWETVVEPGWEISMHMWPLPEPPEIDPLEALGGIVIVDEEKGKGKKKKEKPPPFFPWVGGGSKKKKAVKPKKK